jgi:hypothetical protein
MRFALAIPLALLPALGAAQIPVLGVSPASLTFTAVSGEGPSVPQPVHVINRGSGTLQWRATPDAAWIRVSPAAGTGTMDVTVTIDATRLRAGRYEGRIAIEAPGADDSPFTVPVIAQLSAPSPAELPPPARAAPVAAAGTSRAAGKPDAATKAADTTARPDEPVALTVDARALPPATRNLPYTQAVPVRGGKPPYAMRLVQGRLPVGLVLANGAITGLTRFPGHYQFTVAVTDASAPPAMVTQALTLRVIILQTDTALVVDPPAIGLVAAGAQRVQRARIGVGSGRQVLDWKASSDAAWLKAIPADGVSPGVVQLEANATGLAPGTYVATVTIVMDGAPNSPARVPVQLTVRK